MTATLIQKMAPANWFVDLRYLGKPHLIACGVLPTDAGLLIVDPGPACSLDNLLQGLEAKGAGLSDVRAVLLTHIHLDHAGAAGFIVQANPLVKVYVHERGAPHLIRPGKLLQSARHLYGERMDSLWGAVLPVPRANVHRLQGGEALSIGGRTLDVAYTPGHAIHHVSFLDRWTGTAFIGDTGGMRIPGEECVLPLAPPPDIDVEGWLESLDTIHGWAPNQLFITHCGSFPDAARHLEEMRQRLQDWSERVRRGLGDDRDDPEPAARFCEEVVVELRRELAGERILPYEQFGQPQASWHGLARYWRKHTHRHSMRAE